MYLVIRTDSLFSEDYSVLAFAYKREDAKAAMTRFRKSHSRDYVLILDTDKEAKNEESSKENA